MKKLIIALIIGAVIAGMFDSGNVSWALVLGVFFLPAVFEKKEKSRNEQ